MKESLKYFKLWQEKRNELPVSNDAQSDWLEMRAILDDHMPVISNGGNNKPPSSGSQLFLRSLFIILAAAAVLFVVYRLTKPQPDATALNEHKEKNLNKQGRDSAEYRSLKTGTRAPGFIRPTDSVRSSTNSSENARVNGKAAPQNNSTAKAAQGTTLEASSSTRTGPGRDSSSQLKSHNPRLFSSTGADQQMIVNPTGNKSRHQRNNPRAAVTDDNKNTNFSSPQNLSASNHNRATTDKGQRALTLISDADQQIDSFIEQMPPWSSSIPVLNSFPLPNKTIPLPAVGREKPGITEKSKSPSQARSKIDWGILAGANAKGSAKLPADLYFGPFVTYNVSNKLGVNLQVHLFSPQTASGSYTHVNGSKIDTNLKTFLITDSRKIRSLEIPLYLEYKATRNVSLKAGPVFSLPLKQSNSKISFTPDSIRQDSVYYPGIAGLLSKTKYQAKLNYGISAGISAHFNRFILEATYLRRLNIQTITSGLGSYKYNSNTFQFTLGFMLNKPKP